MIELHIVRLYYSIQNNCDGSAELVWFLTKEGAQEHQDNMDQGWGESCTGSVETFQGSDIYRAAHRDYDAYLYERDSWMRQP